MNPIQALKDKLPGLLAKAQAYLDASATENRAPTDEEQTGCDETMAIFEATEKQIGSLARAQAAQERMDAPGVRLVRPENATITEPPARGSTTVTGGDRTGASKGTHGFQSLGDFAMAVRNARTAGTVDPRLRIQNAAGSYGSEAVGADGGYAVPPDFRSTILKKVQGEDALLSLTDQYTTASNELILPVDEATPWASTGGVQVAWLGEGSVIPGSKPALGQFQLRANKIAALVTVTDELLQDAVTLDAYITNKVPDKMNYAINAAIIGGTGVGQPGGIIGAPSTVTQAAESGQVAATINYANVTKMWSRMYAPCRKNGVWIINQDVEPQLFSMVVTGGSPALPAYLPPGGLSERPFGMLMGRPVYYSEACSAVGTPGDIIFADPKQYASLIKAGGVRTDVSIHLYFDADQTVFRVIMRVGGNPWWKTSIVRAKSALPLSWAVTLAQR